MYNVVQLKQENPEIIERFWGLIDKGQEDDCWRWKGSVKDGLGFFYVRKEGVRISTEARRFAHQLMGFALGVTSPLLRLCDSTDCVNPSHHKEVPKSYIAPTLRVGVSEFLDDEKIIKKFWSFVDKRGENECWLWKGPVSKDGFGKFYIKTNPDFVTPAHRFSYNLLRDSSKKRYSLERICDDPLCVNPVHWQERTKSINREMLYDLYINKRLSICRVAHELGSTYHITRKYLYEYNIPIRGRNDLISERDQTGKKNPSWKGGRCLGSGYWLVYKPEHPNARNRGYISEHIVIALEAADLDKLPEEHCVHHINFDKTDNRSENLVICTQREHSIYHHSNMQNILKILFERGDVSFSREKGYQLVENIKEGK